MRRVAALSPAGADEPVRALLDSLDGVSIQMAHSLDEIHWPDTDCLWLHDVRASVPELRAWLDAGGRLLATLDAAHMAVELGLEAVPPDEVRESSWVPTPGQDASRGLAAFGAHPLFEGLQQGASTWTPVVGEPYRWAVYLATRPAAADVVAVERCGLEVNAARIVAWEYPVGQGGLLCIGSGVCPEAADQRHAPHLRALLGNALAGHGIPHRERPLGARHWPVPGRHVLRQDLVPVPDTPGLSGEWPDASSALALDLPVKTDDPWTLTGRRGLLAGSAGRGLHEAWLHPYRVMRDVAVTIAGAPPARSGTRVTPDQVVVRSAADPRSRVDPRSGAAGAAVVERWMVAMEHPVLYWQVEPGAEQLVHLEWTTDLRRSWPYPAGCGGDLELSVAPDGRRAVLAAVGDLFRLVIDVEGGTLEAEPMEGPAVRFSVRVAGRCRVRLTGAADDADFDRSRQMLARRGLAGLRSQRAERARELATYATSIEVPEPALVEAFDWAKVRMDGLLVGTPGVGRCLTAGYAAAPDKPCGAWYRGADACQTALAQLAVGDRGAPRDTLKFLSLTQDVDGRVIEECSTSGLARFGSGPVLPLYLLLAARYAAWTGELDFLARRWAAVRRALELGVAERSWEAADAARWVLALESLQPLSEALGHPELAEALEAHAAAARGAVAPGELTSGWAGVDPFESGQFDAGLDRWRLAVEAGRRAGHAVASALPAVIAVEGLWGVRPNALDAAVQLAPWFPAGWATMSLERLRVGHTVLSVRIRRRFGRISARIERVHGPRLHVDFVLRGEPVSEGVSLDDVELRGGRVAFEADGSHALVWHA